jgi:hypothetical protein
MHAARANARHSGNIIYYLVVSDNQKKFDADQREEHESRTLISHLHSTRVPTLCSGRIFPPGDAYSHGVFGCTLNLERATASLLDCYVRPTSKAESSVFMARTLGKLTIAMSQMLNLPELSNSW